MKHYNPTLSEDMQRIFNIKSGENTDQVADFIQPTKEVMRYCNIVRSVLGSGSASTTIYTTPTGKDFYLVGFMHNWIKDVAATAANSYINVTIEGVTQKISYLAGITLTVQNIGTALTFPVPIKIDRGTTIVVVNSTNGAVISTAAIIYGYTEEVSKGV